MVASDDATRRNTIGSLGGSFRNLEIESFNTGLMTARRLAAARLARSIADSGGEGGIGMDVEYELEDLEYEIGNLTYLDLVITFTAVGTSIVPWPGRATVAPARPGLCYDLGERRGGKMEDGR